MATVTEAAMAADSDTDHTLVPSPVKKLKQATLQFGRAVCHPSTSINSPGGENCVHVLVATVTEAICTADCCKGGLTPFQPTEASVLEKLGRKQGERYRLLSPTWYSTYPWLTICTTKGKAFCVYCRYCTGKQLLHLAMKGEDAFNDSGFDNWKKAHERFTKHAQSDLHKEAVLKIQLSKQRVFIP